MSTLSIRGIALSAPKIGGLVLIHIVFLFSKDLQSQVQKIEYQFVLDSACRTSAGIFDSKDHLVRTLWNLKYLSAGTQTCEWDRLDDNGRLLSDSFYHLEVLANNVQYTWEGVVGNNSDSMTGSSKIRHFDRISSMVSVGNWLYYGAGYSEGVPSCYKIDVNQPNRKYNILFEEEENVDQNCDFVSTDSQYVWWAGYDPFNPDNTFVYATSVHSDSEIVFAHGVPLSMYYGRTYASVIALDTSASDARITGMAAQKSSNFLFISRKDKGILQIYSKHTGEFIRSYPFNLPELLRCDREGRLWMSYAGDSLCLLGFDTLGEIDSVYIEKQLPSKALALTISQNDSVLAIAFGDSIQQVYGYDILADTLVWTLGQKGGYHYNNFIEDDKFYFDDTVTDLTQPYLCFDETGALWVGDVGNERTLRFSEDRHLINTIQFLPHSYSVTADKKDSSRLFNEYLEYKIDYSKPLLAGNGSWQLYRNWRYGVDPGHFVPSGISVLKNIVTYNNGKTFGFIDYMDSMKMRYPELIELPDSGNFIYSGIRWDKFANDVIEPDGSRTWLKSGADIGNTGYILHAVLSGFDTLSYPVWAAPDTLVKIPSITEDCPVYKGAQPIVRTGTGKCILFNNGKSNFGYHLGAINENDSEYNWLTAKATFPSYRGEYPLDGAFDVGNGVEYPAATVNSVDKSIFWNYHGEFWKNSQTNKWAHVYENGLSVGDFGVTTPDGLNTNYEAFAEGAGNALSSALVKIGSKYYIYHCDESVNSGVHRWQVSGLNTIKLIIVHQPVPLISGANVLMAYFDRQGLDNTQLKAQKVDSLLNHYQFTPNVPDSNNLSMRLSGFIKIEKTGNYYFHLSARHGLKFWLDGNCLIDTFRNLTNAEFTADSIELDSGVLYPYRIELNDYWIGVKWTGPGFYKTDIPNRQLYSEDTLKVDVLDLMSGWTDNTFESDLYGWSRYPENDLDQGLKNHWLVQTFIKSYLTESPDIFMSFAKDTDTYYVERSLPQNGQCMVSWELSGELNFDEDFNAIAKSNQSKMEILDDSLNVLASIEHVMLKNGRYYQTTISGSDSVFVKQSGENTNAYTNRFKEFRIHVDSNAVDYQYGDYNLHYSNSGNAFWKKPSKLRFQFVSGKGTFGAAIGVRNLKWLQKDSLQPKIYPDTLSSICQGDTLRINTDSFSVYKWNTGETTNWKQITGAGQYKVKVSNVYCSGYSAIKTFGLKPSPAPHITQTGQELFSNYAYGNTWYLNGAVLTGANDTFYNPVYPGTYSLMVTDTNGCVGKVDLLVPLNIHEGNVSYACESLNRLWIQYPSEYSGDLYLSDDEGASWLKLSDIGRNSDSGYKKVYYSLIWREGRLFTFRYQDKEARKGEVQIEIQDCMEERKYRVSPNPFGSEWQLVLPEGLVPNIEIKVQMCDINGRVIIDKDIETEDIKKGYVVIESVHLAEGPYIVRVFENGVYRQYMMLLHNGQ